jgi:hypothetical protein
MIPDAIATRAVCAASLAFLSACGGGNQPPKSASDSVSANPSPAVTPVPPSVPPKDTSPAKPAGPKKSTAPAADTARGIVAVVGSERDVHVVLKLDPGTPSLTLSGPLTGALRRTQGADVWVTGARGPRAFEVSAFTVRTVDGNSALDGRLVADGEKLYLVTPDGVRHFIAHPPPPLRDLIGARVWMTGAPERDAVSYGVIEAAR